MKLQPSYWVRLPSYMMLGLRWWNGWQNGEMPNPKISVGIDTSSIKFSQDCQPLVPKQKERKKD